MKIKAVVAGLALALATAAQADVINIVANGGGGASQAVGSLDWATANAQLRGLVTDPATGAPIVGTTFQVYAHARLNAFQDENGAPLFGNCVNSGACEWTFVAGAREAVIASSGTTGQAAFALVPGAPENFFMIYYDPTPDSNNLTGGGFDDGTLILSGTVDAGSSDFTRSTPPFGATGPLDSFNTNNYPGLFSVAGTGGTRLTVGVTSSDSNFFLTPPEVIQLSFQSQQNLPFEQTNPSAFFYSLANALIQGAPTVPGASIANLGPVNGAAAFECAGCGTGNVMFQTDASTAFVARAPEPASLSLFGLGLALLGFLKRRSTKH
jgi:hypothetical protein